MELSVQSATLEEILPWRDLYRREINGQVVHDSLHPRRGWCRQYRLLVGDVTVGYGSVVREGPWKDRPTLFEFYVLPPHRPRLLDLGERLLAASGAVGMEGQTNDAQFCVLLYAFAHTIVPERILFADGGPTHHQPEGAVFRRIPSENPESIPLHERDATGVVEVDGIVAASGGILFHYNRPYGDIYMDVAEDYRRRGLGAYLVQELKRVCYENGNVPSARCRPENIASRRTLLKAGFVPYGFILNGTVG